MPLITSGFEGELRFQTRRFSTEKGSDGRDQIYGICCLGIALTVDIFY